LSNNKIIKYTTVINITKSQINRGSFLKIEKTPFGMTSLLKESSFNINKTLGRALTRWSYWVDLVQVRFSAQAVKS
jgi:hypothetical protein